VRKTSQTWSSSHRPSLRSAARSRNPAIGKIITDNSDFGKSRMPPTSVADDMSGSGSARGVKVQVYADGSHASSTGQDAAAATDENGASRMRKAPLGSARRRPCGRPGQASACPQEENKSIRSGHEVLPKSANRSTEQGWISEFIYCLKISFVPLSFCREFNIDKTISRERSPGLGGRFPARGMRRRNALLGWVKRGSRRIGRAHRLSAGGRHLPDC
jgi:hypothetical protein